MNPSKKRMIIDVCGLQPPEPVLKLRRALRDAPEGSQVTVLATDGNAVRDVPAYCHNAGHHLIMAREKDQTYIFEIECRAKGEEN